MKLIAKSDYYECVNAGDQTWDYYYHGNVNVS